MFRIYNKQLNQFVGGNEWFVNPNGTVFFLDLNDGKNELVSAKNCIVQLNTNLKDKNGNSLFEGDIVKDGENEIGQIIWSDKAIAPGVKTGGCVNMVGWSILFDSLKDYPVLLSSNSGETGPDKVEIIGNIFT